MPAPRLAVLLVDDEDGVRNVTHLMLQRHGFGVVSLASAEAALALVRSDPTRFDVVVTDVMMPGMDGPTLAREIERLRPAMPIVFISGYLADTLTAHGLSPDAINLVHKPFTTAELVAAIRRAVNGSR